MKLYEISEQYQQALSELESSDLPAEVVQDTLEALKGDLEVKAKNVAAFIANRNAEIAAVKEASKKLADRAKYEEARIQRLKEYLKFNMERNEITEIRSPELVLKIAKNPPSVVIDDADLIPQDYKREIPAKYEPDKSAIKKAYKDGYIVPGTHIASTTRLDIK